MASLRNELLYIKNFQTLVKPSQIPFSHLELKLENGWREKQTLFKDTKTSESLSWWRCSLWKLANISRTLHRRAKILKFLAPLPNPTYIHDLASRQLKLHFCDKNSNFSMDKERNQPSLLRQTLGKVTVGREKVPSCLKNPTYIWDLGLQCSGTYFWNLFNVFIHSNSTKQRNKLFCSGTYFWNLFLEPI